MQAEAELWLLRERVVSMPGSQMLLTKSLDSLHKISEWNTENALRAPGRFGGDVCPKVRRSQFTFAVTR